MWSTNRLNLLFNEQVKLSLISGSVSDPCTTLLLCCHKCLYDGLQWSQSKNLVVLEKLLKKKVIFQLAQFPSIIYHAVTPIAHTRGITPSGWGKMRWLYLLAMPVKGVHWMSALEHAVVKPEAAHYAARGMRSSYSPYTTLLYPFKQKLVLKFYNSSSYLFCVFFLQGGTSSYLE